MTDGGGLQEKADNSKRCLNTQQPTLIQNQVCNKSKAFLATLAHVPSCNCTAALVLYTQNARIASNPSPPCPHTQRWGCKCEHLCPAYTPILCLWYGGRLGIPSIHFTLALKYANDLTSLTDSCGGKETDKTTLVNSNPEASTFWHT